LISYKQWLAGGTHILNTGKNIVHKCNLTVVCA
jgi:hypothetical protein